MRTHRARRAAGGLLVTLALLAAPQGVGAQAADFYVAFYLGLSQPLDSDFTVRDSAAGTGGVVADVGFDGSFLFGWKVGGFFPRRAGSPWPQFGLELDVYVFDADQDVEKIRPTVDVSDFEDIHVETLALNLLARYPLGRSAELPNGRFQVYAGIGGGFEGARAEVPGFILFSTVAEDEDMSPVFQGLAGVKLFVTPHVAFFAEYKYSRASHQLQLFDVSEKFVLEVNHFAGGFAYHF